jgi:hypothetical protein
MADSPKTYRLTARAQIHGALRDPGFTLEDGQRGPHRTVVASNIGGMARRHSRELTPGDPGWAVGWIRPEEPTMRDAPLFEPVAD